MYHGDMVIELNPHLERLIQESVLQGKFKDTNEAVNASLESFFALESNAHHWKGLAAMFAENPTDGTLRDVGLNHDFYLAKADE
jgi:Arc/MetJ-type ribon-helix-helix transcriptional regulator